MKTYCWASLWDFNSFSSYKVHDSFYFYVWWEAGMELCMSISNCSGLPWWLVVKNSPANAGDLRLIPGLGRSPGGGHGNPPVFLPGESHGQRSLEGYTLWSCKESDTTYQLYNNLTAPAPNVEKDHFSTELPWHHWQRSIAHKNEGLFLDSQFCSTDGHVHPQARMTLSWLL